MMHSDTQDLALSSPFDTSNRDLMHTAGVLKGKDWTGHESSGRAMDESLQPLNDDDDEQQKAHWFISVRYGSHDSSVFYGLWIPGRIQSSNGPPFLPLWLPSELCLPVHNTALKERHTY